MEAKGCAKRMEWADARRSFYWTVRGRVARSSALAKLPEADPSLTCDRRREILDDLLSLDAGASPQRAVEAHEAVDLKQTISRLKGEYLVNKLLDLAEEDKPVAVDGLTRSRKRHESSVVVRTSVASGSELWRFVAQKCISLPCRSVLCPWSPLFSISYLSLVRLWNR